MNIDDAKRGGRGETRHRLLSVREVADELSVSRRTLHRLIAAGELTAIRIGDRWRFYPSDVDAFVAARRTRDTTQ